MGRVTSSGTGGAFGTGRGLADLAGFFAGFRFLAVILEATLVRTSDGSESLLAISLAEMLNDSKSLSDAVSAAS